MVMVAGPRASPRTWAPERDDERCRVFGARRISDDSSAGERKRGSTQTTSAKGRPHGRTQSRSQHPYGCGLDAVPARGRFGSSEDDELRFRCSRVVSMTEAK